MTSSYKMKSVCIITMLALIYVRDSASNKYKTMRAPDIKDLILRSSKPGPPNSNRLFNQLVALEARRQNDPSTPVLNEAEEQKLKLWSNGVVPYLIDEKSYDEELRDGFHNYFQLIHRMIGVRFLPLLKPPSYTEASRYVIITNRRMSQECVPLDTLTNVGPQRVVIGYDCMTPKNLASVVMQLLGVPPQHNSPDRDSYINVHMDNILDDKRRLFERVPQDFWPFKDMDYDYESITHYGPAEFSKNGKPTITVSEETAHSIGQEANFSPTDLIKINYLYNDIITKQERQRLTSSCQILFSVTNP